MRKLIAFLLAALMALFLAACGSGANSGEGEIKDEGSEEYVKEACIKEAESYVGSYLANTDIKLTWNLDYSPTLVESQYKLRFRYDVLTNYDVADRVCDYILEHASFEVDPDSFSMNKDTDSDSPDVGLSVKVTIIPPATAKDQVEAIIIEKQANDDAEKDEIYNRAISVVSGIQPVAENIPIEFFSNEGVWMIRNYREVLRNINKAGNSDESAEP